MKNTIFNEGEVFTLLEETPERFCMKEDFFKFIDVMTAKYMINLLEKEIIIKVPSCQRLKVMLIIILFHSSGYHCFKHFYLEKRCKYLLCLCPKVVSYNCLVELERGVSISLTLFISKILQWKYTGCFVLNSLNSC